ncbi:trypsin-like cysteine/serine peptidase domain-containing protein [Aspergillus multicolor]|uniref:S1 family peptidase n=1 Tax=Aspergillus multicolor TaxID=41759 RepID=UPI003CCDD5BD
MKPTTFLTQLLPSLLFSSPANALVGGSPAPSDAAPYAAAILSSGWFGDNYICTGSLIAPRTILTSAECVHGSSASSLKVRTGSANRSSGGKVIQVVQVIMHPNYNTNTHSFNVAVLRLQDKVADIEPVLIASESAVSGTPVTLYGWGKTDKAILDLVYPESLQTLETAAISAADCVSFYDDLNPVSKEMMCDAAPQKEQGSCEGDQGGPIVNEAGELVGMMGHYGYCNADGRPDQNMDPVPLGDWIASNSA